VKSRSVHTPLLVALTICAAAVALAGCQTDISTSRALQPLSPQMLALLEQKHMPVDSPILIRLFKEESQVEVWKQDTGGHFALLKTYPICRWSGQLGPKIREGDRQAPEGFYTVRPGQMNPNSHHYLSFDIGYPNAYDDVYGRTGGNIMMHGGCSSAGCYAMTDEQIAEIYALARESFYGNQRSFQIQAYPFHMTPLNLVKHLDNPNMRFWMMLKEGNDHFEVTHLEPKIDVCEKRYVFDAQPLGEAAIGPTQNESVRWQGNAFATVTTAVAPSFDPAGRCPAYEIPHEIALAVAEKYRRDESQMTELLSRGASAAPVQKGTDGGIEAGALALDGSDVD
jgi:murein L,D-transpeptidase YafK